MRVTSRALLRADAVFEAVVGAFLLLLATFEPAFFPWPAQGGFLVFLGVFLLLLVPLLWWFSVLGRVDLTLIVAVGNILSAILIASWRAGAMEDLDPSSNAFALMIMGGLFALGGSQLIVLRAEKTGRA